MKEDIEKNYLIFSFAPSSFLWAILWKTKRAWTRYQSLFGLQNISRNIPFLGILLPWQFWWFNSKGFLSYCKNYNCWLMQINSQNWQVWLNGWVFIYELSGFWFQSRCCPSFNWPFESENYGKEEKKNEYLKTEKGFLDEIKSIFHNFEMLSFRKILKIEKTSLSWREMFKTCILIITQKKQLCITYPWICLHGQFKADIKHMQNTYKNRAKLVQNICHSIPSVCNYKLAELLCGCMSLIWQKNLSNI